MNLFKDKKIGRKPDIRAVRGPETRKLLINVGFDCPGIYGVPAVIMPLIYNPDVKKNTRYHLLNT